MMFVFLQLEMQLITLLVMVFLHSTGIKLAQKIQYWDLFNWVGAAGRPSNRSEVGYADGNVVMDPRSSR